MEADSSNQDERIHERYDPIRRLGAGANGEVLLVRDTQLENQLIALKVLYPHLMFSETSYGRFLNESRVTMKLSHPNILPTFGCERMESGITYLKMEYNDGRPLDAIIADNPTGCPIDFVIHVLASIAEGLRYAHSKGVVHRDLKPGNVLVSKANHVRITDFGLAQIIRSEIRYTGRGEVVGTPHYMAPEILRGEIADVRSDIYALGVLGYELLTGHKPYEGVSFWDLADKILSSEATLPLNRADAPPWLLTCIMRCLEKQRMQRYRAMDEVLAALQIGTDVDDHTPNEVSGVQSVHSGKSSASIQHQAIVRAQQYTGRLVRLVQIIGLLIVIPLAPPHINGSANDKYSIMVYYIERKVGTVLSPLRSVFGISRNYRWPSCVWGDQHSTHKSQNFIHAGYPPDTYYEPSGQYPIHYVSTGLRLGVLRALLKYGANIDIQDAKGRTPLLIAVESNSQEVLAELFAATPRPNPNIADTVGTTPLHIAARRGRVSLAQKLLLLGAETHRQDAAGNTPLHLAVRSMSVEMVQLLLQNKGNPKIRNDEHQTALEIALTLPPGTQQTALIALLADVDGPAQDVTNQEPQSLHHESNPLESAGRES